jgi:transcription elongation factor Elf1
MAKLSDELTSTFPCPHCGHEITENLARLKDEDVLTCPSCGKGFRIESGGTIGKTVDQLGELDRAWEKLTKK